MIPSRSHLLVALFAAPFALGATVTSLAAQTPPIPLDTIPVIGSRASAELPLRTRSVRIISRAELERLPARTVQELLGWTLGAEVGARSPAQADLAIRGAGFEQVLVLVDGVRMSDPQTGHFDLNLAVPLDRIERIEILRGPASALYGGDAVGGVVNVVTRDEPAWSARLEGGSFGTVTSGVQGGLPLGNQIQLRMAGEWTRSDGHREGTDYEIAQGSMELRAPLAGGRLAVDVGRADRDFGADHFYAPFPSFESTGVQTAGVRWSPAAAASVRVEPRLTWRRHDDDFILVRDDPALYRNRHRSTQLAGEVVVRSRLAAFEVAGGAELGRNTLASNNLGDREELRSALFAELVAGDGGPLVLSTGARLDHHEKWGAFLSPSLSAAYEVSPTARVRTSIGRAFRGPSFTERHYVDPAHEARDDLDPERSTAVELGVEWVPAPRLQLSLTGFHRWSRDLIDWARPSSDVDETLPWETHNVNRARFRGVEAEGNVRVAPRTRMRAGASFLSVDADAQDEFVSKYALRPLADHLLLAFDHDLPGGVQFTLRGAQGRRVGEASHRQVDLRLSLPLLEGVLHVDAVNLNDSDHPDLTGNPVAGRALFVGYRIGGVR